MPVDFIPRSDPVLRFFHKITFGDDCWEFQRLDHYGYGRIRVARKDIKAHRMAMEIFTGTPVPPDMSVDHAVCQNKSCVRPDHLEIVTRGENVLRAWLRGEVNPRINDCTHGKEFWYMRPHGRDGYCRKCQAQSHKRYMAARTGKAA